MILYICSRITWKPLKDFSTLLWTFLQPIQNFINQTWLGRYETDIPEHMLTLLWSIIVSIFTLGGLIGASFGGNLATKLGRYISVYFGPDWRLDFHTSWKAITDFLDCFGISQIVINVCKTASVIPIPNVTSAGQNLISYSFTCISKCSQWMQMI